MQFLTSQITPVLNTNLIELQRCATKSPSPGIPSISKTFEIVTGDQPVEGISDEVYVIRLNGRKPETRIVIGLKISLLVYQVKCL